MKTNIIILVTLLSIAIGSITFVSAAHLIQNMVRDGRSVTYSRYTDSQNRDYGYEEDPCYWEEPYNYEFEEDHHHYWHNPSYRDGCH